MAGSSPTWAASRWGVGALIAGLLIALVGPPAQGSAPVSPASPAFGWGKNSGALGDGTTNRSNVPVAALAGASSGQFVDVSGGGDHSCGIDAAGVAYCWGTGAFGRLGTGNTGNTSVPTAVVTSGALPDTYKDIEAGEVFSCGIGIDDSVYCWGQNDEGQLGDGTLTSSSSPVPVLAGQSPGQFTDLAVGAFHACAIATNQQAYCWGYNGFGNVGVGNTTRRNPSPLAVVVGSSPGTFTSIAAGDHRTCAIGTDSRAYCWGSGTQGGNGNGASTDDSVMVQVSAGASSGLFSDVAPGGDQTCGVSTSGAAYCWGRNSSGQLGTGNNTAASVPVAVSTAGSLPDIYTSVSAGRDFSCGIASGGSAYCWGTNGNGELGIGSFGGTSNVPVAVSVAGVLAGRRLLQIDLGPEFVMAIAGLASPAATFDTPVPTPDGYTVNVTNYDALWTWAPSVSAGAVTAGTATGSVLPLTVTGLAIGQSATVTVATTRAGYLAGSGQVSSAAVGAARTPTFGTATSTADGFTVDVTNYDDSWTWTPTVTSGAVVAGTASGSVLPLTVTGLAAGASATVTVTATRATYATGSATVSGSAAAAPAPPSPIVFRPPGPPLDVRAVAGDASAEVTWSPPTSSGTFPVTAYRVISSPGGHGCTTSGLTCSVTGLSNGTAYTFTVSAESAVGWGSASVPSEAVTPVETTPPTITIVGSRAEVRGRPGISIAGTSTELGMGALLVPFVRFAGGSEFVRGSARIAVDVSGEFTWSRTTRRAATVYVQTVDGSVTSNEVRIVARQTRAFR